MRNTTLVYSSVSVTSVATGVILSFLPLYIFEISKSFRMLIDKECMS